MSDFLVNLARRGAGLAPVIRARVPSPPTSPMPDVPAAGSKATPKAAAPALRDAPAQSTPAPQRESRSAEPSVTLVTMISAAPAPDAQRTQIATPAMMAMPSPAVATAPDARPVAQIARGPIETVIRDALPPAPLAIAPPLSIPREALSRDPASLSESAPLIAPASIARNDAADDSRPRDSDRQREVAGESVRVVETVIKPMPSDARTEPAVVIRAAEENEHASEPRVVPPAPERTVLVRIGSIEIHGPEANTGSSMPVAAPAASTIASVPPSAPAGGFEEFAALRSYAPWAW